jgi:hypothetical protein
MSIIISQNNKNAQKIDRSEIEQEDYLQNYIHENPDSIPVYELSEEKRLFVAKREYGTNSGPIDAIAVDQDGDIYIVETKLYKNSDKRTVVAQALDYGAALWKHENDFGVFIAKLDKECFTRFDMSFTDKVKDFFKLESVDQFLDKMRINLNEGNLKFVILMDSLDERLKDLILYVNQNSQFDIYAVQLEFYKFDKYEIAIPRLFGAEVKKRAGGSASPRGKWDESSFIAKVKDDLGDDAEQFISLYNDFKKISVKINWGTGAVSGSYSPIISKIHDKISPFSFYTDGNVEIKFNWIEINYSNKENVELGRKFLTELRKNTDLNIESDHMDLKRTYRINKKDLFRNFDGFVKTVREIFELN